MKFDFLYIPWPVWTHQLIGFLGACSAYLLAIGLHKLGAYLTSPRTVPGHYPDMTHPYVPVPYVPRQTPPHVTEWNRRVLQALQELEHLVQEALALGPAEARKLLIQCPALDYLETFYHRGEMLRVFFKFNAVMAQVDVHTKGKEDVRP